MKKSLIIGLVLVSAFTISCRKKDIQPVISLNGHSEQTISLGQTYLENGAVAMDNKDGDISEDIAISGSVDNTLAGQYRLFYNVKDSEGNKAATATRFVNVVNDADYMFGTYEATPTCTGTMTAGIYHTSITASTKNNNQIFIRRVLHAVDDEPVVGNIDGNTITIPAQTVGSNTVFGNGSLVSGNFLLYVNVSGAGAYECSINHVKL